MPFASALEAHNLRLCTRGSHANHGDASDIWPLTNARDAAPEQGDGTAAILEGHEHVMTVSFHAASNFPARKQRSHLDVALPDGMQDDDYLRWALQRESQLSHTYMYRRYLLGLDAGKKPEKNDQHTEDSGCAEDTNTLPGLLDSFRPDPDIFHQPESHNRAEPEYIYPNYDALAERWRMCN